MRDGHTNKGSARLVSLGGVLAALSLAVLYLSSVAPGGRLGLVAAAGLVPAAAVVSGGFGAGVLCYLAAGLLSAVLLPMKDSFVLYMLFFGLYPLVKYWLERPRKLILEWALKLVFFNSMLSLFLFVFTRIFFAAIPAEQLPLWVIYGAGNAVFAVYDLGFSKLMTFYAHRIDGMIRKSRGGGR